MVKEKKAIVILSGGIDSSTALAVAKDEGYKLYALTFDYNQRHKRELESARLVASTIGVKEHLIIRFDLRGIGGSALTSEIEVPKSFNLEIRNSKFEVIPVTYVPARNTIFLSFAIAWAEVLNTGSIFMGVNSIDYSGYPDCRPEYLRAFEDMANLATKASVEGRLKFIIRAPLISMKKSEIIRKGIELGFDYSLTWSCYDPRPANPTIPEGEGGLVPCGLCDSCIFRANGFKEAGIKDPLIKF